MVFLGKISRSSGLSPSFLGGGDAFEHKTTESALKMPNQENNGKREINFSVVCIDLLGTGVNANKQQNSMKKNGEKLIFLQNKNQLWQPSFYNNFISLLFC